MRRMLGSRGMVASLAAFGAVVVVAAGPAAASVSKNPTTKTFSVIAKNGQKAKRVQRRRADINARCGTGSAAGTPVVFAFSGVPAGDLLGHMFDGAGRTHIIHNTQFNKGTNGVRLTPTSSDFDGSASSRSSPPRALW